MDFDFDCGCIVAAILAATLCNQLANPLLAVLPGGEARFPLPHGPRSSRAVELPAGKELGVDWVGKFWWVVYGAECPNWCSGFVCFI